jgi:hypothetical protein
MGKVWRMGISRAMAGKEQAKAAVTPVTAKSADYLV